MAVNLRLRPETELALRDRAEQSGRSQQDLMREAIDQYLGLAVGADVLRGDIDDLIEHGVLLAPAQPYRRVVPTYVPRDGLRTEDLLDREDRL